MSVLEIFEKVNLVAPIEQRVFFNYFDDTVRELQSMYSGFVFDDDTEYHAPSLLSDENDVLPLYHSAMADNIVFLARGDDARKSEFIRKSRDAYLKYWNDNAKGRKMRSRRW